MDANLLLDIDSQSKQYLQWKCNLWFPPKGEEIDGAPPVDLIKMLESPSQHWLKAKAKEENLPNKTRYRFPEQYMGMSSANELVKAIGRAAIQCGFELPISTRSVNAFADCRCPNLCKTILWPLSPTMASQWRRWMNLSSLLSLPTLPIAQHTTNQIAGICCLQWQRLLH